MFIRRGVRAALPYEREAKYLVAPAIFLPAAWVAGVLGLAAAGVAGILRCGLLVASEHAHLQAHGFADP